MAYALPSGKQCFCVLGCRYRTSVIADGGYFSNLGIVGLKLRVYLASPSLRTPRA
jgi:hypothetical protein